MILQKIKTIPVALILGGAAGIATAITAPQYVGAALAFSGGILGGAAVADKQRSERSRQNEQAARVGACFTALYEQNKGVVDPVQLSFLADVPLERAHTFLTSLAEGNQGQKIPTDQGIGVLFSFPHVENTLDRMTQNANAWVQAQTKELEGQLEQHKRVIQMLQAQQAAASLTPRPPVKDPDPWTPQPGI